MTDRKATIVSMIGEELGNYRITAPIDRGGMGNVFRAEHTHLGRAAAIKLLRSELTENDDLVQRFFNEAKAATAIRHPGIVEVYDFGYAEDGRAFFAMELLEGESLGKRIARLGRLSEREAVKIGRGITSVLKAAHAKGIIHRDLKPDNIFLVPDDDEGDRVKVLDFGVAKLSELADTRQTQTGVLMGTPLYMAPEQARAASGIDHRADLYSVGCILYEMLAGVPPFKAEGAGEIIAMQMFADPQPLNDRLTEITPEIEELVMKLLAKEPADRYQSAVELYAALGAIRDQLAGDVAEEREFPNATVPRMSRASVAPPLRQELADTSFSLMGERPSLEAKKSSMPLIAGLVTVGLAGLAVFFLLFLRGDETPDRAVTVPDAAVPAPSDDKTPPPEPAVAPVRPADKATTPTATTIDEKIEDAAKPRGPRDVTPVKAKRPKAPTGAPVTTPQTDTAPSNSGGGVTSPAGLTPEVRTPITQSPVETNLEAKPEPRPEPRPEAKPAPEPTPEPPAE